MAPLPRPFTSTPSSAPARSASSPMSWMVGTSTMGSISFGTALVAGRKRVPSPAAGITTFCSACFTETPSSSGGANATILFARPDRLRDRVPRMLRSRFHLPRFRGRPGMRLALLLGFALAGGQAARAEGSVTDPGAPFLYTTVWMPRSTAMAGAHAAVATSNDAFLVNPAGLAPARRHHLEIDGALDPQFHGSGFLVTAVDASSLAVASGLMYARFSTGHLDRRGAGFLLGAAYAYDIGGIYFGGVTKYLNFDGPDGQSYKFAQH